MLRSERYKCPPGCHPAGGRGLGSTPALTPNKLPLVRRQMRGGCRNASCVPASPFVLCEPTVPKGEAPTGSNRNLIRSSGATPFPDKLRDRPPPRRTRVAPDRRTPRCGLSASKLDYIAITRPADDLIAIASLPATSGQHYPTTLAPSSGWAAEPPLAGWGSTLPLPPPVPQQALAATCSRGRKSCARS